MARAYGASLLAGLLLWTCGATRAMDDSNAAEEQPYVLEMPPAQPRQVAAQQSSPLSIRLVQLLTGGWAFGDEMPDRVVQAEPEAAIADAQDRDVEANLPIPSAAVEHEETLPESDSGSSGIFGCLYAIRSCAVENKPRAGLCAVACGVSLIWLGCFLSATLAGSSRPTPEPLGLTGGLLP